MRSRMLLLLWVFLTLAGCGTWTRKAPVPLPTVLLDRQGVASPTLAQRTDKGIIASGVVVPAWQIRMAFTLQERVSAVNVSVGDRVRAGQVLARLDDSVLQAQIRQAKAAVAVAEANYNLLAAGPTPEQLRQAEAAVISARAAYSRTLEAPREAEVEAAKAALEAARANYDRVKSGPRKEDYATAEANLRTAEMALRQAQSAYDRALARNPAGISGDPAALALEKATNDYQAAKAVYEALSRLPDEAQLSAAYQQVALAKAQLDHVLHPVREYEVEQARAQVYSAQARLEELKAGARPEQLAAARAQVESAQAALAVLEAQLQKYVLVAPLDGIVLARMIEPNEVVLPGTPLLVLGDLDHLRVETADLSERDVPQIKVGQPVQVFIKALGQQITGYVSAISPLANTLGGDVVYKTTVDLDMCPPDLRVGMSAEVQF